MERPLLLENAGNRIYQLDLIYDGHCGHSSGYIIKDSGCTIIETGTALAVPLCLRALEELGIRKEEVEYVFVTHIHLDHAGGAGVLLKYLPRARLVVHPRGAPHMINPEKLSVSARVVYGDRYEGLFGEILPVDEKRIITWHEGMTIDTGERFIELYDSPGHSFHHLIAYSRQDGAIWSGDAAGISFPGFLDRAVDFTTLTTTPTQFDPDLMKKSLGMMKDLNPSVLYLTHFGACRNPQKMLGRSLGLVDQFLALAEKSIGAAHEEQALFKALLDFHRAELEREGLKADDPLISLIESDCLLNAQGLLYHIRRERASSRKADR